MNGIGFFATWLAILFLAQGGRPVHNEADRLARWKQVEMPYQRDNLTAQDQQMIERLVDACRLVDSIYWRQSDPGGMAIYRVTRNVTLWSLFRIMGSRWDLLDENRPFLGEARMPPGHSLYPHDLTLAEVNNYVKTHPEQKQAIFDEFTVVKREGTRLVTVPYHEEYKELLTPMASILRQAADSSSDPAFANYLKLRADALLTDDYYKSDLAWVDLKDPKVDLILAPYETYLDNLLGVKTSYGASILIRNDSESEKLAVYQKYVPDIQDALPLPPADRPSKRGHLTPMEVMDAPYRAGDLKFGYQAVADNLPNDPRIHAAKGTKKIFFKNFMDARVKYVVLPIAQKLMEPSQAAKATGEGYLAATLLHEICHGLGPAYARVKGKEVDIREAVGPVYSGLEEAKADVVGMFGLKWLAGHNALPKDRLEEYYASYVAGIFRTLRFGTGEAHGRAEMMEFNVLLEQGALSRNSAGLYVIDYEKIPIAIASLSKELLEIEATGDRARAETWFAKYDKMPSELTAALKATKDIPVDIYPNFAFGDMLK